MDFDFYGRDALELIASVCTTPLLNIDFFARNFPYREKAMDGRQVSHEFNLARAVKRGASSRLSVSSRELSATDARLLRQAHAGAFMVGGTSNDGSITIKVVSHAEVNTFEGVVHTFILEVCADEPSAPIPVCYS